MPRLELTVEGRYWHQLQPYGGELVVWAKVPGAGDLVSLGSYRIDCVEQDDAPHGPIHVVAERAESDGGR